MTTKNDGGPALPCFTDTSGYGSAKRNSNGEWENFSTGLSLRDWFATQEHLLDYDNPELVIRREAAEVLAGCKMPERENSIELLKWEAKWRAALKYIRADAMIEERSK